MMSWDKSRFILFLSAACTDFYVHLFQEGDATFDTLVYCELPGLDFDEKCSIFIDKFSSSTGTDWISGKRLGDCVRFRFKKTFLCKKSNKNKTKPPAGMESCDAKIEFKWKIINKHTIKNDVNLKNNLSCLISIKFKHTHPVKCVGVFMNLGSFKNADELFKSYFRLGLTPSVAKVFHEISLAGSSSYLKISHQNLADASTATISSRHLLYLYDLWRKREQNGSARSHLQVLQAKKTQFEEHGNFIGLNESTLDVVIITPLMVAMLKEVADEEHLSVLIVTSKTSPDLEYHVKYLICFFVPSKIGALPIACVLQKSEDYTESLAMLKDSIENITGKAFCPGAFHDMDDSVYLQTSIPKIFPTSLVFQSSSSVILSVWKFLHIRNILALQGFKPEAVLSQFRKLIKAESMSELESCYNDLNELISAFGLVKLQIGAWWARQEEWSHVHREEYYKENDSFMHSDLSLRIFRDAILQRGKNFTDEAWIEIVCITLECYFKKRIEDFANGLNISSHFSLFCQPIKGITISRLSEHDFEIAFSDQKLMLPKCKVNVDLVPTCDCAKNGNIGRFCGHLNAIQKEYLWPVSQPTASEEVSFFKSLAAACDSNKKIQPAFNPETEVCEALIEQIKCESADNKDDFNSDLEIDDFQIKDEVTIKCESQVDVGLNSETQLLNFENTFQTCKSSGDSPFELVTVNGSPIGNEEVPQPIVDPLANYDQSDPFLKTTLVPKLGAILKTSQATSTSKETVISCNTIDGYEKMTEQKFIVRKIKFEFDQVVKILNNSLITSRPDLTSLYQFHNSLQKIRSTTDAVEFMEDYLRGQEMKRNEDEQKIKTEPEDSDWQPLEKKTRFN